MGLRIARIVLLLLSFTVTTQSVAADALAVSTPNFQNLLIRFNPLVRALESGHDVRAIIHLDRCLISNQSIQNQYQANLNDASIRLNFSEFIHYKITSDHQLRNTVATSTFRLVEQSTSGELWTLFTRLDVFEDDTAILHIVYYDPIHHKRQLSVDWTCEISNGQDDRGLYLYDKP